MNKPIINTGVMSSETHRISVCKSNAGCYTVSDRPINTIRFSSNGEICGLSYFHLLGWRINLDFRPEAREELLEMFFDAFHIYITGKNLDQLTDYLQLHRIWELTQVDEIDDEDDCWVQTIIVRRRGEQEDDANVLRSVEERLGNSV